MNLLQPTERPTNDTDRANPAWNAVSGPASLLFYLFSIRLFRVVPWANQALFVG